jgi:acetolactate synthase I/II/III large subunit
MALGLKLAQPSRRVVQVVGDGAFHFSSPDSVYATAQQYQLPIFTVVLDNGGWQAVKASVQRVYPDGMAQRMNSFQSRLASGRQGEQRRFADVASAFGSYGADEADEHPQHDAVHVRQARLSTSVLEGNADCQVTRPDFRI